ncbi:LPXTG cell wall anchor domain-containing protein, partial [Halomonas sp. MG34]|nr:LPXTG cell wall anchor domain-containing protein [Halomonas sp. MG34]
STDMSTQQALLAFVAYQKLVNGTGSVYQFSAPVEEEPPNEPEQPEDPKDTEKPEADPNQPGTDNEPKDEDPKPEKGDNTSDKGKNNETNEHVKQLENAGDKQTNASGEKLPNTSTNTFNFLASGLVLLLIGGAIFLMWRKRQANESM